MTDRINFPFGNQILKLTNISLRVEIIIPIFGIISLFIVGA